MKIYLSILFFYIYGQITVPAQNNTNLNKKIKMERTELCKKNYTELFGGGALSDTGSDPELMQILQKFIFGEVFDTGKLDIKLREMITLVTLTAQQTLPQLKAHTNAALNVGVTPIEIREAIYQCAPVIGFPKTLNAVGTINEVFTERGIALPLEKQGTVNEGNRYRKGVEIESALYGDEQENILRELSGDIIGKDVSRFITEMHFGDFYTRKGLDIKNRELLTLCVSAALGNDSQIRIHVIGCFNAGNSKDTVTAAIIQTLPYIGFPNALNAINIINQHHNNE